MDCIDELNQPENAILFEGAQGFYLDVDHGEYPYVTSSNTGVAAAINTGIPPQTIRSVYGVAKIYETYVGAKKFQPNDNRFKELQKLGEEFGATTGRARQCNFLNLTELIRAVKVSGVTELIFNKVDVIKEWAYFSYYKDKLQYKFDTFEIMQGQINNILQPLVQKVVYSSSKEDI